MLLLPPDLPRMGIRPSNSCPARYLSKITLRAFYTVYMNFWLVDTQVEMTRLAVNNDPIPFQVGNSAICQKNVKPDWE